MTREVSLKSLAKMIFLRIVILSSFARFVLYTPLPLSSHQQDMVFETG